MTVKAAKERKIAVHIFLAELTGERREKPTEADFQQEESLWLPVREADGLMFFPGADQWEDIRIDPGRGSAVSGVQALG